MVLSDFKDFLKDVGPVLAGVLFGIMILGSLFSWRVSELTWFSYSDFPSYVLAAVAVSSLYVAWREFIRKTEPKVDCITEVNRDEDSAGVSIKMTNTGEVPIRPASIWYACVERIEDRILFVNDRVAGFDEDGLAVGETAVKQLESDVMMLQVTSVGLSHGNGEAQTVKLERKRSRRGPHSLEVHNEEDLPSDFDYYIQPVFDAFLDEDRFGSTTIPIEHFEVDDFQDIIQEHIELDEDFETSMSFWTRLRQKYIEYKYGFRILGHWGDDPVIRTLEWLEGDIEK